MEEDSFAPFKVYKRKIQRSKRPREKIQYWITLPVEYGKRLEELGVNNLLVVFNHGLCVILRWTMRRLMGK